MRYRRTGFLHSANLCLPLVLVTCTPATAVVGGESAQPSRAVHDQILRGRQLVIQHGCGDCHGGSTDPASTRWLAGRPEDTLPVIPAGGLRAWPPNITPDDETGIGRYTERQIFNALRYGLRPKATPDVHITSAVPGQGNHPAAPNYLSPAMPWMFWRYHPDDDLRAIAAYLKRGVRPIRHQVQASQAPPDFWASEMTVEKIGTHVPPAFPTVHEQLAVPERRAEILRGRQIVLEQACASCHGGGRPDQDGWLAGIRGAPTMLAAYAIEFPTGPFRTRPRNITPDNTTGIGRFTERQLFNALRYGLRPGETPDVEITSRTPGQGNFPANPKFLAPPMPWWAWRHMPDADLRAIVAYLKFGVRPVRNLVPDSEGPSDFWASDLTDQRLGAYPAPTFPTARERVPGTP